MPYDTTAKRNEAFVNTMIAYATYFVGKIDYASSVTGDDPTGLRYKRLKVTLSAPEREHQVATAMWRSTSAAVKSLSVPQVTE